MNLKKNAFVAIMLLLTTLAPAGQLFAQLTAGSLNTRGLNYETELTALYLGDFRNARLKPGDTVVALLYQDYINAFGRYCPAYLPADKVPITVTRCATESITKDGYGNVVSSSCIEWVEVPTGLYADPVLYGSCKRFSTKVGLNMMSKTVNEDMFAGRTMVDDKLSLGQDMARLVEQNKGNRAALERFQQNLYRFVEGQAPLRLPGNETLASLGGRTKASLKTNNLNLPKLLDDLITENSRGWMINRYQSGSVANIQISERYPDGTPRAIHAGYGFTTMGQHSKGNVLLTFANGLPQCLYFADAPKTCRHPSRRIMTDYEKGHYLK